MSNSSMVYTRQEQRGGSSKQSKTSVSCGDIPLSACRTCTAHFLEGYALVFPGTVQRRAHKLRVCFEGLGWKAARRPDR